MPVQTPALSKKCPSPSSGRLPAGQEAKSGGAHTLADQDFLGTGTCPC